MDRDQVRNGEPEIPGYRIEGVLGRGATGTVYRARQLSVDREVALKVLHPDLVGATNAERRLQREARATARLSHPNIISAIDMGSVAGMWWYAMELVDGVALSEKIRERPLTEREALRIFIPLVEALQHAFERGVVHRDIKPANILVERGGRALLVDLGLAFADDDPTVTKNGATLGTPHYISPEQARDPSGADAQSDLWSLGATMYHAVIGRPPFAGDSVAEILSAVLYERVPDPLEQEPTLSSGFALVLRKCLSRDRGKRYATPAELLVDLERIRERRAPSVKRRSLEPVARDPMRVLRLAGGATLVLVCAGFLAWIAFRGPESQLGAETSGAAVSARPAAGPVESLARAAEGPAAALASAHERASVLLRTNALPPEELDALEPVRLRLEQRLASELSAFRAESEARLARALDERRFQEADLEARSGLKSAFTRRVGSANLPDAVKGELELWVQRQVERVESARSEAVAGFANALDLHFDAEIAPAVERHKQRGEWRRARALLTSEARVWIDRVDAPREGLAAGEIEEGVARLQAERIGPLRERLDADWSATDTDLAASMNEHRSRLQKDLESRVLLDAPARLREAWRAETALRGVTVPEMPPGLLHLGLEALARGERELQELESRLVLEDAQRGLAELEDENVDLWKARRYADVALAFTSAASDPWRAPVRATIELRAREARLLQDFLARAAAGIARRNGESVDLRLGSILLSGKVGSGADPLQQGFQLTLDTGRVWTLALRPLDPTAGATGNAPAILGLDAIERFAGVAQEGTGEVRPEDRLLRGLMRMRDGDVVGARAALNAGPLPREEPLVADLEARLRREFEHLRESQGARRTEALERLHLIRRESRAEGDGAHLARRIERLLADFGDVLTDDEVKELRRARDDRFAGSTAPAEASVAEIFRPNALEDLPASRVRLRYEFGSARAGAFDPGAWICDGAGWVPVRYAESVDEFLARPAPTLALREPLKIQPEALDVRAKFESLPGAPPELVLVSVAGFHVVLVGPRAGLRPRCLVDVGEAADVVARARNGEGKEFASWRVGAPLELRVAMFRARGVIAVDVDGKRVVDLARPAPRGEPSQATLSVRSWEPVRLHSISIEAAHR